MAKGCFSDLGDTYVVMPNKWSRVATMLASLTTTGQSIEQVRHIIPACILSHIFLLFEIFHPSWFEKPAEVKVGTIIQGILH